MNSGSSTKIINAKKGDSKHSVTFKGSEIPDGKYKINIAAVKNTKGSFGSRRVDLINETDTDFYVIDFKYPIPEPSEPNIFHFFDIFYNYEEGRNEVRYAIQAEYKFDEGEIVDGIEFNITDDETVVEPFETKMGNIIRANYIPLLKNDGFINYIFDFKWHDYQDKLMRKGNRIDSWKSTTSITDIYRDLNINKFGLKDDLENHYGDSWTEISPHPHNTDFKNKPVTFEEIKEKSLKYIRRKYRKDASIINSQNGEEEKYTFFCLDKTGPYFRKRLFQRHNGNETEIIKRYDSIPYDIGSENDFDELKKLSDSVDINSTHTYNKISNTMNWNLKVDFKDVNGSDLTSDKIDHAMLYIYNSNDTSNHLLDFDVRQKNEVKINDLKIGNYVYKLVSLTEANSSEEGSELESEIKEIKPLADDVITANYTVLDDEDNDGKLKLMIEWKIYIEDVSGLYVVLQKRNAGGKYTTFMKHSTINNFKYDTATFTNLTPGEYKYYFTFSSESCIFKDKNKHVKYTTPIELNSSSTD